MSIELFGLTALAIGVILGSIFGFSRKTRIRVTALSCFAGGGGAFYYFIASPDLPLLGFLLVISFGISAVVGTAYIKRKYRPATVILHNYDGLLRGDDAFRLQQLRDKYGEGFNTFDLKILDAIEKNQKSVKGLAIFLNRPEDEVKERLAFLDSKGVINYK